MTRLLVAAALFGMFYFCTLHLQQLLGFSALKTGVSCLPTVAAIICAAGAAFAFVWLPRRKRDVENAGVEAVALSFARCPGAPYCGHLARLVAFGRRIRGGPAAQS